MSVREPAMAAGVAPKVCESRSEEARMMTGTRVASNSRVWRGPEYLIHTGPHARFCCPVFLTCAAWPHIGFRKAG